MKPSFGHSMLIPPHCQCRDGGARRHPHPIVDGPRVGRQAPALLSSTAETNVRLTHTNRSPINPVHFNKHRHLRGDTETDSLWVKSLKRLRKM